MNDDKLSGQRLAIVIPARYGSTRLPGKPLADILGKPMIQHVFERGRLGIAIVLDDQRLAGVITDGDIRRALENYQNPIDLEAATIMTTTPITILASERFAVAEEKMREAKINSLIVVACRRPCTSLVWWHFWWLFYWSSPSAGMVVFRWMAWWAFKRTTASRHLGWVAFPFFWA